MGGPAQVSRAILITISLAAGAGRQGIEDPGLRAAVERFFATQQAEDADGYLALWSAGAQRPRPEQLKHVFDSGDDTFSEITILKVTPTGARVRVRVSAVRVRTRSSPPAGAAPPRIGVKMLVSLTYVREGDEWKLLREAPASDDLAATLIETPSADERRQLFAAEPELLNEQLLAAIARRGAEAAQLSNYPAARLCYERMLEVARHVGDRRHESEALQNIGNTHYFERNLSAALDAYDQRLAIERARDDPAAMASALLGIATVRYSFAEYGPALSAYREALALQERAGDEASIATTLVSTGNVLYVQGDFDAAIADFTRSRELNRKLLNTAGEANALEGLGRVYMARGDYAGALEAFSGVLAEARARNNRRGQGNATLSIGEVHFRLGNVEVARTTFEESRVHFEAMNDAANVGRVWQAVALTDLVAGRFAISESGYQKSAGICSAASDLECVAGALVGLAFAQTAQDEFTEAIASYKKAIAAFTALKRPEQAARAQVGLSQALSGSGDHKAALDAAASARRTALELVNDDVLWRALIAEARAHRRLSARVEAVGAANAAAAALDKLLEAARARPSAPVPRDTAAIFATLAILHADNGDAPAAFDAAERMRAHDLRIALATAEREISRGMTDEEREEERALAVELVSLHAQLSRERALPKPDSARLERLQAAFQDAARKQAAQRERLFARLPDLRTWRGLLAPATRSDLAHVLTDRATLLVELVVDDQDLLVLIARQAESGPEISSTVLPIARKALADRVAMLTGADVLRSRTEWRGAFKESFRSLDAVLAAAVQGASRVILVPHEILWRVPFEAVPLGDTYLGGARTIAYASSVTALVRTAERAADPATGVVLLAGMPEVASTVRDKIAQVMPGWTLRAVEDAGAEMQAIAEALGASSVRSLRGTDASESELRRRLHEPDVIHFAAPFRVNGASPLFSQVLLAGDQGPPDGATGPPLDAALEAREVMNVTVRAPVIVLSDPAALSMRDAAEAAPLVHWAWRAAGARYMLVPRWRGDDAASRRLLADFHRRIAAGDPPERALAAAQEAIRRADARSAPFYWAGWLLIGGR